MKIAAHVHAVIDAAEATDTRLTAAEVALVVCTENPDVVRLYADSLAVRAIRGIAGDQLSARTRSHQPSFPNMSVPTWLSVAGDDGVTQFVPARVATVDDFDRHIDVRERNLRSCRDELKELRKVRRALGDANPTALLIPTLLAATAKHKAAA